MNLKVLPLENWMDVEGIGFLRDMLEDTLSNYTQISPKLGRPGIYRIGEECWFELKDGRAFLHNRKTFDYNLKSMEALEIMPTDIEALAAIAKSKFATKKQLDLHYMIRNAYDVRKVGRDTKKTFMRIRRESSKQQVSFSLEGDKDV